MDIKGGEDMLKFKAFCVENNIRQREIADVLGITVSRANRKLNGKDPFTLEQVKTLCKTYSLSADIYFV